MPNNILSSAAATAALIFAMWSVSKPAVGSPIVNRRAILTPRQI
jgi:hypothetical protein